MSDFNNWVLGWQEYAPIVLVEKFEERPSRIERALTLRPDEHAKFVWEWENAAKAYDMDKLSDVAIKWAPRAVDLVIRYGKDVEG